MSAGKVVRWVGAVAAGLVAVVVMGGAVVLFGWGEISGSIRSLDRDGVGTDLQAARTAAMQSQACVQLSLVEDRVIERRFDCDRTPWVARDDGRVVRKLRVLRACPDAGVSVAFDGDGRVVGGRDVVIGFRAVDGFCGEGPSFSRIVIDAEQGFVPKPTPLEP